MIQTRDFTVKPQALGGNRVRFVASTAAVDAQRTRIIPRGCRLDRFKAAGSLPLLWAHKRDGAPDDVLGRVVDVEVSDTAVTCTAEFEAHARAQMVLGMVRRGVLRGCSIGFCDYEPSEPGADGVSTIAEWTLCELSVCPVGANPEALAVRAFTVRTAAGPPQTRTHEPKPGRSTRMNPLDKLGLKEGAAPEEVAAALIKYLKESADGDEDKLACVVALLGMLAPAASDDGAEAAAKAMAEEVKTLQARVAELEAQKDAPAESPEQQAERAIASGRWPVGQRAALVEQYKAGKAPFLFAERTFAARHQTFTAGGKPVAAAAQPNFGTDTAAVENRAAASTMAVLKKLGVAVTPEQFAAAQRAEQE